MSGLTVLLRMVLAVVMGGVIGLERERKGSSAGLRTHVLVTMSSSLLMLLGLFVLETYGDTSSVDPLRVMQGVMAGVGFLGAGAIIHGGSCQDVTGLTTAASIWLAAALGLAVGAGFYSASVGATILAYIVLKTLRSIEKHFESLRGVKKHQ